MSKQSDKPYMDAPEKAESTTEQLIYGGGEKLSEITDNSKKKSKKMLTEDK